MDTSSNIIQDSLEDFLKREGLHELIPNYRRDQLFPSPIIYLWLAGLLIPAFYFAYYIGKKNFLVSIMSPVLFIVLFFLLVGIFYVVRKIRTAKDLSSNDARSIGGIFILGTPFFIALGLGLILWSWVIPLYYLAIYTGVVIISLFIQKQGYRIYIFVDLIVSTLKAFVQSLKYLLVILPLLLVIILLSVFSADLWKIIGLASLPRLFSIFALILLPALILYVTSLEGQTRELIANVSGTDRILGQAKETPFLKKKVDEGLISEEEWRELIRQLSWRHIDKLVSDIRPTIHNKTKRWLALLIGLTSLVLLLSFFLYFYVFFSIAIEPSTISGWTGLQSFPPIWTINILGNFWVLSISSIGVAVAKVSLVLGTFAAAMSIVYSLTDETVKKLFTNWLFQKSSLWVIACCLYKSLTEPNYQFWEYVVDNKKDGIANVSIVVPKGFPSEKIGEVCNYVANHHDEYRRIVIITAFEQNFEKPIYKRSGSGRWWQFLHNKATGFREFNEVPLDTDELRYQHFLGKEYFAKELNIPNGWFGNTSKGVKLGKAIWDSDKNHEWVLHPFVFESKRMFFLEIYLIKRKETSEQYHDLVKSLFNLTRQIIPTAQNVVIDLYFRDTVDVLAHLMLNDNINLVDYRDERISKSRYENLTDWIK